ncbi:hypothetical protein CSUI_006424 [Cystoisospora suis]|uniref:Uncharacterized protein n=1 Tax=Cystoisospora suis TaxID=483139 RepID=A0A2C6KUF1_9APIC|nr:hypothetical protein CSUI_006424 [Cystoisospora suis]
MLHSAGRGWTGEERRVSLFLPRKSSFFSSS